MHVNPRDFLPASRFEPSIPADAQVLVFVDGAALREAARSSLDGTRFAAVCARIEAFEAIALVLLDEAKAEKPLPRLLEEWPAALAERVCGAAPEWGEPLSAQNQGAWGEVRAFLMENDLMGVPMLVLDPRAELYPAAAQKWLLGWRPLEGVDAAWLDELDARLLALGLDKKAAAQG
jgi:hypothetical protein